MMTREEVIASMPRAKVFSVLDATSGYWQVKLDEASSKSCTFNTPYGRYRFTSEKLQAFLAYASRPLTPAQQHYAQIQKETLAIVYGAQKFRHSSFMEGQL